MAGDIAQYCRVQAQQQVANDGGPDQGLEVKGHAHLAAGKHGGGEEGKAEQQDRGGDQAFASAGWHFTQGVIVVEIGGMVHGGHSG